MAFLPVKLVLVALKEVVRTRKIAAGVHHAHHAYHNGFLIMVIIGYVKGWCLTALPPIATAVTCRPFLVCVHFAGGGRQNEDKTREARYRPLS